MKLDVFIIALMFLVWAAGFIGIDLYYEATVINDFQRWANTTGAQGLYIMLSLPVMFWIETKISMYFNK